LRVETTLPKEEELPGGADQKSTETKADDDTQPQHIVVEIVDTRLHVVLARRSEDIMKRTLRVWTSVARTGHGLSNFDKITF